MGWPIVGIVAAVILIDVLIQWPYIRVVLPMFEEAPPFRVEEWPPDPDAERVSFPSSHKLTLRGSLYRRPNRTSGGLIIFCHEFGGNHWTAMSYCQGLWKAGFDILAFDFRNQGESDGMPDYQPLHWLTDYEVRDVLAALKFVKQRDDLRSKPIGVFGISRGGSAALAAASRSSDVKCVVCEATFFGRQHDAALR